MSFAASKYFLQIREVSQEYQHHYYSYWPDREAAVTHLIAREQAAIASVERSLKRNKANLAKFMKKEGRSPHTGDGKHE